MVQCEDDYKVVVSAGNALLIAATDATEDDLIANDWVDDVTERSSIAADKPCYELLSCGSDAHAVLEVDVAFLAHSDKTNLGYAEAAASLNTFETLVELP